MNITVKKMRKRSRWAFCIVFVLIFAVSRFKLGLKLLHHFPKLKPIKKWAHKHDKGQCSFNENEKVLDSDHHDLVVQTTHSIERSPSI